MRWLLVLFWVVAVAFPLPGAEFPFELENGLIWVRPEARGKRYDFVLDTGAGSTVLDPRTVKRLRLRLGEAAPVYGAGREGVARRVEGLEASLGGVPLEREVFAVHLRRAKGPKYRRMDGVIGLDFFRGRVVQIDFAKRLVRVLERPPAGKKAASAPLKAHGDAFLAPVSLNGGAPAWARVDTGCNSVLEWAGEPRPRRAGETAGTVAVGSSRLVNAPVGLHPEPFFAGEAGLLGNGFFSRHRRVTIDARRMRLILE